MVHITYLPFPLLARSVCNIPCAIRRTDFDIIVTGSLALRELASPGTTQDSNKLTNWLIIYRTVSLSLCIILTSLIAGRLLTLYLRSSKSRHSTSPLKDTALMLVKSAMLETVSTLVYVISVALRSPLQNVFLPILGQVQVNTSVIGVSF
jgi:hypothetical protein